MIVPGGSPGTSFTKSATTRFNNNQIKAAQSSMPHNMAAQASLRKQTSQSTPNGAPVGSNNQNPNDLLSGMVPQVSQPVNLPTGGSGLPPEAGQDFDPAVFKEQMLGELVSNIRTQAFINSPRVKDAAQSVRLKNFFNNTNPNRTPDSRNLLEQVLNRIRK